MNVGRAAFLPSPGGALAGMGGRKEGRLKGISDLIITASPHPGDPAASISLSALPHLVTSLLPLLPHPSFIQFPSSGPLSVFPSLALMPCWWSGNRGYGSDHKPAERRSEFIQNIPGQLENLFCFYFFGEEMCKLFQVQAEFELSSPCSHLII